MTSLVALALGAAAALLRGRACPGSASRALARPGRRRAASVRSRVHRRRRSPSSSRSATRSTGSADRVHEFRHSGTPDLSAESSRFTFNAGSEPLRHLAGRAGRRRAPTRCSATAAAASEYTYLRERDDAGPEPPRCPQRRAGDCSPSSASSGFAAVRASRSPRRRSACVRARRSGPAAAALRRSRSRAATYWLVHTSVDWFWPYPAMTAPVLALLGSACAPAVRAQARRAGPRVARVWLIAALARARAQHGAARCSPSATSTTPTRAGAPTSAAPTTTSTGRGAQPAQRPARCSPRARSRARPAIASARSRRSRAAADSAPRSGRPTTCSPSSANADPAAARDREIQRRGRARTRSTAEIAALAERLGRRPARPRQLTPAGGGRRH